MAYLVFCGDLSTGGWVLLLAAITGLAVVAAGAEARARGQVDPGPVVIDEAAGYLVTVAFLPHGLWTALAGFVLFRVLDILKPPPARQLEHIRGGWGIVLDDVAAGAMGHLLLRLAWALTSN